MLEEYQEKMESMTEELSVTSRQMDLETSKMQKQIETLQEENVRLIMKMGTLGSNKEDNQMNEKLLNQQVTTPLLDLFVYDFIEWVGFWQINVLKKEIADMRGRFEPMKNTFIKFIDSFTKGTKEYEDYLRSLTLMLGFQPQESTMIVGLTKTPVAKKKFGIF
jgi:hypothetical protein